MAITDNAAWDEFITRHRWATLTTLRTSGAPVSSIIAYARDGDTLVISTPGGTFKRSSIERDPRVNVCIMTNAEPFNFVAIEGHATVEHDRLEESTRLVFDNIADTGFELPDDLPGWLERQRRVILRVVPERVYGVIR